MNQECSKPLNQQLAIGHGPQSVPPDIQTTFSEKILMSPFYPLSVYLFGCLPSFPTKSIHKLPLSAANHFLI
jgi:hypothetical protein